jgi:16S rRNA (guanine527-N7)-methyltransferase
VKSARFSERLRQRAAHAGVTLDGSWIDQIETYYQLLQHWNRKINLTALPLEGMSDQAIDRLIIEPLIAAAMVKSSATTWCDLGSGGGSPAIPMRILRPLSRLTLVEARSRKAAFLREVVRELSLLNVTVIADRFESVSEVPELAGSSDLVTVRAVRLDTAMFLAARRLLRPDAEGELFVFGRTGSEVPNAHGFEHVRILPLISGQSELIVFQAISEADKPNV